MNILMPAGSGYAFGGEKSLTKQQGPASTDERQGGFTLIEILVVIGIIAILALIVLVAINPARQFALSRNTQRTSNVESILNAIGQNMVDNKGMFVCANGATLNSTDSLICSTGATGCSAPDVDLGACLSPTYIPALPSDPKGGNFQWTDATRYNTGYTVSVDATGRVTVKAPGASTETALGATPPAIQITR
jgi:type IV pilus assembly protein PilA